MDSSQTACQEAAASRSAAERDGVAVCSRSHVGVPRQRLSPSHPRQRPDGHIAAAASLGHRPAAAEKPVRRVRPRPQQPGGAGKPRQPPHGPATVLLHALREEVPGLQGPQAARPGAPQRPHPHLRAVRQGLRLPLRPHQAPPDGAPEAQAVHLPDLPRRVLHEARHGGPHPDAHRGETVPLQPVRKEICAPGGTERAPAVAQRGEAALVPVLRERIFRLQ